ncbi:MAG: hypothetical protein RLZZ253_2562 [Verrucomicrobiota bacterium]
MFVRFLFFILALLGGAHLFAQVETTGADLYRQHCAACHGQEGLGIPQAFPPLVRSDFISDQRERALRAPLEGLRGRIVVNGQTFDGWMPPVVLRDEDLAKIFNHVFSSWGNANTPTSAVEIGALRAKTTYPTYEKLVAAMSVDVLPPAPAGWRFSFGANLEFQPTRLTAHPDGKHALILAANGDIWTWDISTHEVAPLWLGKETLDPSLGDPTCLGLATDNKGRLYFISNQCNRSKTPVVNEVTIFRTEPWSGGDSWTKPKPWLVTAYSFGVGPYNHGVNHLAQGPDGLLYVSSGSRTDGGETGQSPKYDKSGETPLTAKIWRINPETEHPNIEIFAHGLRNTYHFTWDYQGHLLGVENGTDADTPEELNLIEQGKHYGFPYEFGDWTTKPYPHTPDAPKDLTFVRPFKNVGQDANDRGGSATFTPHSSPSTILELGPDWPAPLGNSFLISRFGNYLKDQGGFDLVQARLDFAKQEATVTRVATPLARPISMIPLSGHRLLIAEYCRGNSLGAGTSTPGRLILLEPNP